MDGPTYTRLTPDETMHLMNFEYVMPVRLASGEIAAMMRFIFTVALCVGIDPVDGFYRCRYCYPNTGDAVLALLTWDGQEDPPGPWIKQKGRLRDGSGVDRSNPQGEAHGHLD